MKNGLGGSNLPQSEADFKELKESGKAWITECVRCKSPFSGDNVKTRLGWQETQISGMCESCWEAIFPPEEE